MIDRQTYRQTGEKTANKSSSNWLQKMSKDKELSYCTKLLSNKQEYHKNNNIKFSWRYLSEIEESCLRQPARVPHLNSQGNREKL